MAYETTALRTTIELDPEWTVAKLGSFLADLKKIPEITYSINHAEKVITVVIDCETTYLSHRSPAGTHEFCRGWVVRGICDYLHEMLGEKLDWELIEWIRDRRQVVKTDDNVHFEIRKVDLHSGTPVA